MLRAYGHDCDGRLVDAGPTAAIPPHATWIDLEEPTRDEEKLVERSLGIGVPTRDDLVEIEPSSRYYSSDGALYMTLSTLIGASEGHPTSEPIGFVLCGNQLVTIRYGTPKPVRNFIQNVLRDPELTKDAMTVLLRLLDALIERMADELEDAGAEMERISSQIFRRGRDQGRRVAAPRLEALLSRIGRVQSLVAKVRETAVSTGRLIAFLTGSERMQDPANLSSRQSLKSLAGDTSSLIDHSGFLGANLTFLLDASLGLISVEQNAAMKLFSWAALVFLPPTLVAGVFGMNFRHMPELEWVWGYPMALTLMLASAVLPLWFLKRRGWI